MNNSTETPPVNKSFVKIQIAILFVVIIASILFFARKELGLVSAVTPPKSQSANDAEVKAQSQPTLMAEKNNTRAENSTTNATVGIQTNPDMNAVELAVAAADRPSKALLLPAGVPATKSEYSGSGEGDLTVLLRPSANELQADISTVVYGGCSGSISGPATVTGNVVALKKIEDDKTCTITLVFSNDGQTAEMNEQGCSFFHGAACAFIGQVSLVKSASTERSKFVSPESAPIKNK